MKFRNPQNGYVESVSVPGLWCLCFGFLYFAVKGVWTHAVASLVLAFFTFGLSWLVYPFFAAGIVRGHYMKLGWSEV